MRPHCVTTRTLLPQLVLLAGLAGCGGGSEEDTSTTETELLPTAQVAGTWKGGSGGLVDVLTLVQSGERITGTAQDSSGTHAITASLFGYDLTFSFVPSPTSALCRVKAQCFATLFETQLRGSCKVVTECPDAAATTQNHSLQLTLQ